MQNAYILTGSLKTPTMIELDESLSLAMQKVRVIVEPMQAVRKKQSLLLTLNKIQAKQEKRNYISPRKEEVDLYITRLRDDWN
ncbi:MAG: hypothetical protein KBF93_17795 [Leptospiraceae bacterium]|nr:hypothetical protein [Leptospiraceae bacterium]